MWLYRLMWNDLPVYTREGLIRLTEAFIRNQEDNKEHLIATGYRNKVLWEKFPWLEERLGNLYPTKTYESFAPVPERPGELSFSWATLDSGGSKVQCSYKEGPIFDVLDAEQAQYIERLRPELFALKMTILHRLLAILKAGPLDDPENQNFREILGLIEEHDIETLILTDNILSGKGRIPNARPGGRNRICYPGGLTGILDVASHYITEAKTGLYDQTKKTLWKSYSESDKGDQRFNGTPFAAIREMESIKVSQNLDQLGQLLVRQSADIDEIQLILADESEILVRIRGKKLSLVSDNLLGDVRDKYGARVDESKLDVPNKFLWRGVGWIIEYGGDITIGENIDGFCYNAHVLYYHMEHKKRISGEDLYQYCVSKCNIPKSKPEAMTTYKDITALINEKKKCIDEIKDRLRKNNDANIADLTRKISDIEIVLRRTTRPVKGKTGNTKRQPRFSSTKHSIGSAISQSRKRAFNSMLARNATIALHFRNCIRRRNFMYGYEPEEPTEWLVELK